eukprot:15364649-Ditylum_brightwellii.AAC.1
MDSLMKSNMIVATLVTSHPWNERGWQESQRGTMLPMWIREVSSPYPFNGSSIHTHTYTHHAEYHQISSLSNQHNQNLQKEKEENKSRSLNNA